MGVLKQAASFFLTLVEIKMQMIMSKIVRVIYNFPGRVAVKLLG
jgi:hypothetical protein